MCDVFVENKPKSGIILGFPMCTKLGRIKLNNDNNINKIESEEENKQKTWQTKAQKNPNRARMQCW